MAGDDGGDGARITASQDPHPRPRPEVCRPRCPRPTVFRPGSVPIGRRDVGSPTLLA